jgi:shikimate dehydrogenase
MKKHLIIGNPISHSLSPKIHNYWFKKNNINGVYDKMTPTSKEIEKIIQNIKDGKIHGMNVTVPFKQDIIKYLDDLSDQAKKTNSVNTIFKKDGKTYGDNTDIFGFEMAIKQSNVSLKDKTALIFGAGGVVPSIVVALQNLEIKKISISNRTKEKIKNIKDRFSLINEEKWGDLGNHDIYINATSVGLKKEDDLNLDLRSLQKNKTFFDVIYNPPMTNFLKKAKDLDHKIINGETMFLYQAQKAFELWHEIVPDIDLNLINFLKND